MSTVAAACEHRRYLSSSALQGEALILGRKLARQVAEVITCVYGEDGDRVPVVRIVWL